MPENDRLSGCLGEINVDFVEREATSRLLMKLSIQFHLARFSLSNTVSFLEIFGVDRVRSTIHHWVHKADLQPESGRSPNHVAVDETVIRLDDEQYWLYAAVGPGTNDLIHTQLELTTHNVSQISFWLISATNTMSMTQLFSLMDQPHFSEPVASTTSILDTNGMEIGTAQNVSFVI